MARTPCRIGPAGTFSSSTTSFSFVGHRGISGVVSAVAKGAVVAQSLKGSLVGPAPVTTVVKSTAGATANSLSMVRNGPVKASLYQATKIAPHKGEVEYVTPHQGRGSAPTGKKPSSASGKKQQRPPSPGTFMKTAEAADKIYAGAVKSTGLIAKYGRLQYESNWGKEDEGPERES